MLVFHRGGVRRLGRAGHVLDPDVQKCVPIVRGFFGAISINPLIAAMFHVKHGDETEPICKL